MLHMIENDAPQYYLFCDCNQVNNGAVHKFVHSNSLIVDSALQNTVYHPPKAPDADGQRPPAML